MAIQSTITNSKTIERHETCKEGGVPTLNRRKMFVMSTALAATAIAPASSFALAPFSNKPATSIETISDTDKALFAAIEEWKRGHEELQRLDAEHSVLENLASETEPAMPSELFEALEMPKGNCMPTDMNVGWAESSLRDYVETGRQFRSSMENLPNDAMHTNFWWDDISNSTRQRAGELLQIRLAYVAKIEAHWEKAEEAQDRYDDQVSKQFDKMMEIAKMPVCSAQGLSAKCKLLLDEPMFGDMTGDMGGDSGIIAKSLIGDIQAIVENCVFHNPPFNNAA